MPCTTVAHWENAQNTAQLHYLDNAMQLEPDLEDSLTPGPVQRLWYILSLLVILTQGQ